MIPNRLDFLLPSGRIGRDREAIFCRPLIGFLERCDRRIVELRAGFGRILPGCGSRA
jgi:hypothetical protein